MKTKQKPYRIFISGPVSEPMADHGWIWVDKDFKATEAKLLRPNSNRNNPQYDPYTIYLFDGAATKLLAKYAIGSFANWNPEAICVDKKNGCIWVGEDCGDEKFSLLWKIDFTNL